MHLSVKIAASFLLTAILLAFSACAKKPDIYVPDSLPTEEVLKARLATALEQFDSVKGFARIEYRNHGEKKAADHVVFAQHPDRLRLETLGLFGSPAMLAATDGVKSSVLFPGEGLAYVGTANADFLGRVTRLPLTPEMAVSIILRRPDLFPATDAQVSYLDEGISRLVLRKGRLSQTVDFDRKQNVVRVAYLADDRPISIIGYSEYKSEFPGRVDLELVSAGAKVSIKFDDIATNVELDEALFRLAPSAGYKVEPFPEH